MDTENQYIISASVIKHRNYNETTYDTPQKERQMNDNAETTGNESCDNNQIKEESNSYTIDYPLILV